MVFEVENRSSSYMERFGSSILRAIQTYGGYSFRSINSPWYEKETKRKLQRICSEMEGSSVTSQALTNREENSIVVDTLPSPYYDMLVDNTFTEFANLLFSMGRIEDGIRKGRVADTRASILEKKGIVFDEHVQTRSMERENKRKSCMMSDESVNNLLYTSPYTSVHYNQGPPPQMITQGHGKEIDSSYSRSNKRKRIKVYHSLSMNYKELPPILI